MRALQVKDLIRHLNRHAQREFSRRKERYSWIYYTVKSNAIKLSMTDPVLTPLVEAHSHRPFQQSSAKHTCSNQETWPKKKPNMLQFALLTVLDRMIDF